MTQDKINELANIIFPELQNLTPYDYTNFQKTQNEHLRYGGLRMRVKKNGFSFTWGGKAYFYYAWLLEHGTKRSIKHKGFVSVKCVARVISLIEEYVGGEAKLNDTRNFKKEMNRQK